MLNKIILIGNVGKDPECKQIGETDFAKFSLATSETYKDKSGQKVTNTEWHNITVWRGLAKVVEQYVKKGSKLYVEGKIEYKLVEKGGEKKYFTQIVARELKMLDSREEKQTTAPANNSIESAPDFDDETDSLPF